MNREIKFRAWNGKQIWFPGHFSTDQHSHQLGFSGTTLMQYTGLLDRNGVEIYEGDILKNVLQYPLEHQQTHPEDKYGALRGPVAWHEGWLYINADFENSSSNNLLYKEVAKNYEITGNIYENPELLK